MQKFVIVMDGGLFEYYIQFSECMESLLKELFGDEVLGSVEVIYLNDGFGVGVVLFVVLYFQYFDDVFEIS